MTHTEKHSRRKTEKYQFTVGEKSAGLRLDQAIAENIGTISRQRAKTLISAGAVWIDRRRVQIGSRKIKEGAAITVYDRDFQAAYEINSRHILYHDGQLLFYRKEPGIPTQGTRDDNYNNLYAALTRFLKKSTPPPYLGLHHRLDRDTSGVILFTIDPKINRDIHLQFKTHKITKTYLVLVEGVPDFASREFCAFISGQNGKYRCAANGPGRFSKTRFEKLAAFDGYSLLRAVPETGRTHQVRLHLAAIGHPALHDPLYGNKKKQGPKRTLLHSESIRMFHPGLKKTVTIRAELFDDMKELLKDYSPAI